MVFDADHAVVEFVSSRISFLDIFRLVDRVEGDDLHPVSIWVKGKCDMSHSTIGQFLLEFVARVFDPLASSLDSVYADANVAEAFAWFGVAVGDFKVVVFFGAVVVGEFQDALTRGPVLAAGEAFEGVVREEVQIEFRVGVFDFIDLFHAKELVILDWQGIRHQ